MTASHGSTSDFGEDMEFTDAANYVFKEVKTAGFYKEFFENYKKKVVRIKKKVTFEKVKAKPKTKKAKAKAKKGKKK